MDNLNQYRELEQLLRNESEFCTEEGHLLKNAIVEAALAMCPKLLRLLMSNEALRKNFFVDIDGVTVFDKVRFQKFVMNKRFLPDSYTSFKNKIGLVDDNENFIADSREIVLAWPYKDCILEGGATRESEKRSEIFWNEILAPNEINRICEPKVLTKFEYFDGTGLNNKAGCIVKGNNLLVLCSLLKKYRGKVKMIYIDPPYNTGNDSFAYNDTFNHSTWLTFMRNRLEIAKDLLADDGSIFVQLDWNEVHYCKVLMDEIFGRNCFRNEIIWCYNGPGSPNMKQLNRKHDNILWYSKNSEKWIFNGDAIRMESEVHQGGFNGEMNADVSNDYTEKGKIPEDWWTLFHTTEDLEKELRQLYDNETYIKDADWFKAAVAARIRIDGKKRTGYLTEKPYRLLERLIKQSTNENDLIIDFFAGSGTTGYVANYLNRKFILVEQLDDTISLIKKRFENDNVYYCELATANQKFIEQIEKANSNEELTNIWNEMQQFGFLSWKIQPEQINEYASDFAALSLDDQKRFLIECLDKNLLYVPLSEIDNEEFEISDEDKKLNKDFYSVD